MANTPADVLTRLWRRSTIDPVTQCWVWGGYCMKGGYGRIHDGSPGKLVHRVSWRKHHGAIPDGMDVLHRCDNPPCWNPDHLFLGDDLINTADKMAKGRHRNGPSLGSKNGMAVLDESVVLAILMAVKTHRGPQAALAKRFGVTQGSISMILAGRTWKHVVRP